MVLDFFLDSFRGAVLITGLVVVMMMMIESFNISSGGQVFQGLRRSRVGQVAFSAFLGSIPGCMGGFASVSLYTHGMLSFGALVAMMIASSGDEAFVMLAMFPDKALWIFLLLFGIAVAVGTAVDFIERRRGVPSVPDNVCSDGLAIHDEDVSGDADSSVEPLRVRGPRHFTWKRAAMFAGVALFIAALVCGLLEHEHSDVPEHAHGSIDLLSEDWMNVLFAVLSVIVLGVIVWGSDHFVDEHLWHHIICRHLPRIFAWTFGVLIVLGILMDVVDISAWISDNTLLMILLATAVGLIPESGPHLVFVTLFATGVVPLPVLLASSISQDGHAALPLLAENRKAFLRAKAVNCAAALVVGISSWLLM